MSETTYKDAGVNIDAGNEAVDRIRSMVNGTHRYVPGKLIAGLGGFSGLWEDGNRQVWAASTDGVGTKLLIAGWLDRHDTVGIDLVAMCVNDLIACGIFPGIFLDYIAMGRQIPERTEQIVAGIVKGCMQAECALIGGEMAEMPDMYREHHYDMAGFAIGHAPSRRSLIMGEGIEPGQRVWGLSSSGIHSNGYSLVRKVFGLNDSRESAEEALGRHYPKLGRTLGEELLEPTTIYVRAVKKLVREGRVTGMANITGGGLVENPPRVLPEGCAIKIEMGSWRRPAIFDLIQKKGEVSEEEMRKTFNLGIGFVVIAPAKHIITNAVCIGEVVEGDRQVYFSE